MDLPKLITPQHGAANLKLFVESCKEHTSKLTPEDDEWAITSTLANLLPTGRHYWMDPDVCTTIADRISKVSNEDIERMLNQEPDWKAMPGPSFVSFAKPMLDVKAPHPLLGIALLPTGVVGWLAAATEPGRPEPYPYLKYVIWPDKMSWLKLRMGMEWDDSEMDWWAMLTINTMGAGPELHHQELQFADKEGHNHFRMNPDGGTFAVSLADQTLYPYDGSTQARLN
jgi:hypothetical protein